MGHRQTWIHLLRKETAPFSRCGHRGVQLWHSPSDEINRKKMAANLKSKKSHRDKKLGPVATQTCALITGLLL